MSLVQEEEYYVSCKHTLPNSYLPPSLSFQLRKTRLQDFVQNRKMYRTLTI